MNKAGQMHGVGRCISEDGRIYEGQFQNGKKLGFGRGIGLNSYYIQVIEQIIIALMVQDIS